MKIKKVCIIFLAFLVSFLAGRSIAQYKSDKKIFLISERADRNAAIIKTFDLWMKKRQQDKSIGQFLFENGFSTISIYGMHFLGECLYNELQKSSIEVRYAIDKRTDIVSDINIVTPEEELETVDAVIVTPIFYFDEIRYQLLKKVKCPVLSLEDILKNM